MKSILKAYPILLVLAFLMGSCSGEDGKDGATGPEGPQGEAGTDGIDGNANVTTSPWIPSTFNSSIAASVSFSYDDPQFSTLSTDTTVFLVYGRRNAIGTTDIITSLPVVIGQKSYFFEVYAHQGKIYFRGRSVDPSNTLYTFNDFEAYRYVIIPANVMAKQAHPDFKKMDYEEVMDYFGLED